MAFSFGSQLPRQANGKLADRIIGTVLSHQEKFA
jgi:hypothetical protein